MAPDVLVNLKVLSPFVSIEWSRLYSPRASIRNKDCAFLERALPSTILLFLKDSEAGPRGRNPTGEQPFEGSRGAWTAAFKERRTRGWEAPRSTETFPGPPL